MQKNYKFLIVGMSGSIGWLIIQAVSLYLSLRANLEQWVSLLPGLLIYIFLVWYTVAVLTNKVGVSNLQFKMIRVLYFLVLPATLFVGLRALASTMPIPILESFAFTNDPDIQFWSFVTWAALGSFCIQVIAVIISILPCKVRH